MTSNNLSEEFEGRHKATMTYYTIDQVCAMEKPERIRIAKAMWGIYT